MLQSGLSLATVLANMLSLACVLGAAYFYCCLIGREPFRGKGQVLFFTLDRECSCTEQKENQIFSSSHQ